MPVVKPEVRYIDLGNCLLGESADVKLESHHSCILPGPCWVHTSKVLRFIRATLSGPVFETQNTIYTPAPVETKERSHQIVSEMEKPRARQTWGFLNPVRSS